MGGGSSVLSPELSSRLTQPSLNKFHQMQQECESKNMSPMEMYVFLTARYEELVEAEMEAVNAIAGPSSGKVSLKAETQSSRSSARTSAPASSYALTRQQTFVLEEDFLDKDIQAEIEESSLSDVHPIYDPYIESVVGKVFSVVDDPHVHGVVNMLMETGDISKTASNFVMESSFVTQLPDGSFECPVCRMPFENRRSLDTHVNHSPIHSINMKIRKEIFQSTLKEAQRLATLAEKTIGRMHAKEPSVPREDNEPNESEATGKTRWKKAVNKVICNRLKAQFLPLIEQICGTPAGVKLLHAGSKFFYNAKATFDLQIYLHVADDVVEIVPHFIPGRKQKRADIHTCPRIYLNFRVLVPLVLGVDITNSRLSIHESGIVAPSTNTVSGVTSRVVALATTQTESDSGLSKTIDTAITSFVLNKLAVLHEGKGSDYSLIFDTSTIQNSPVLAAAPSTVRAVPVPLEKIKSQYEEQLLAARQPRTSSAGKQTTAAAAIGLGAALSSADSCDGPVTARASSDHGTPRSTSGP